jgi:hypothetical protein
MQHFEFVAIFWQNWPMATQQMYALFYQGTLTEGKRLSTVDHLVLTSLDKLFLILPTLFSSFQNELP